MPLRLPGDRRRMLMIDKKTMLIAFGASLFATGQFRAEAPADRAAESAVGAGVSSEELLALANAVNLPVWVQLSCGESGGRFDEYWVVVYSPKDSVGAAGDWNIQITQARALVARATRAEQKRWLSLFIKAGEAVGRKNAPQLVSALRAMEAVVPSSPSALDANRNFFTAK